MGINETSTDIAHFPLFFGEENRCRTMTLFLREEWAIHVRLASALSRIERAIISKALATPSKLKKKEKK